MCMHRMTIFEVRRFEAGAEDGDAVCSEFWKSWVLFFEWGRRAWRALIFEIGTEASRAWLGRDAR